MTNFFSMAVRRMLVWETTEPLTPTQLANQDVVVLLPWDTENSNAILSMAPSVIVLMYLNAASCSSSARTDGLYATGVGEPRANQSGWLLRENTTGKPFTFTGFDWLWAADIGNVNYQDAWLGNALKMLNHFDGIFVDDVNPTIGHGITPSNVAGLSTDALYGAAMTSFVENVFPQIRRADKQVYANIASSWIPQYNSVCTPWLDYVDGALNEYYWKIPPP